MKILEQGHHQTEAKKQTKEGSKVRKEYGRNWDGNENGRVVQRGIKRILGGKVDDGKKDKKKREKVKAIYELVKM